MTEADYIKAKLKELGELERAATPADWYIEDSEVRHDFDSYSTDAGFDCSSMVCNVPRISEELDHGKKNRVFISEFRNAATGILRAMEILVEGMDNTLIAATDSCYEQSHQCLKEKLRRNERALRDAAKALGFEEVNRE